MNDKKTYKLTIEINEETKSIEVKTDDGQTFNLQSLALFGGDARTQEIFIKMYGSSADAAWAFAKGFQIANSIPDDSTAIVNFYKQSAAHICQMIDPLAFKNVIDGQELLEEWEKTPRLDDEEEDKLKWN